MGNRDEKLFLAHHTSCVCCIPTENVVQSNVTYPTTFGPDRCWITDTIICRIMYNSLYYHSFTCTLNFGVYVHPIVQYIGSKSGGGGGERGCSL